MLCDSSHERHITGNPGLDVQRADPRGLKRRHARDLVRNDGASGSHLDERIDVDNLRAATICLRQRCKHPRRVRSRIYAQNDEAVRLLPIRQIDGALACADGGGKRTARAPSINSPCRRSTMPTLLAAPHPAAG